MPPGARARPELGSTEQNRQERWLSQRHLSISTNGGHRQTRCTSLHPRMGRLPGSLWGTDADTTFQGWGDCPQLARYADGFRQGGQKETRLLTSWTDCPCHLLLLLHSDSGQPTHRAGPISAPANTKMAPPQAFMGVCVCGASECRRAPGSWPFPQPDPRQQVLCRLAGLRHPLVGGPDPSKATASGWLT